MDKWFLLTGANLEFLSAGIVRCFNGFRWGGYRMALSVLSWWTYGLVLVIELSNSFLLSVFHHLHVQTSSGCLHSSFQSLWLVWKSVVGVAVHCSKLNCFFIGRVGYFEFV